MARTRWPVGPGKPRPLVQAGQIRPAPLVGAVRPWDPADRSSRRTARTASADSEVRPGPRLPTLRPYSVKIGEAGPEALPTLSLPTRCVKQPGRLGRGRAQVIQLRALWVGQPNGVIVRPVAVRPIIWRAGALLEH